MKKIVILALTLLLTACSVNQSGRVVPDNRVFSVSTFAPLAGGLLGSVACYELFKGHGSQPGWTAACGLGGYLLTRAYTVESSQVLENNQIGQSSSWTDPQGRNYSMTPTNTYYSGSTPCRNFQSTVEIDGQTEVLSGQACRQSDGTWKTL